MNQSGMQAEAPPSGRPRQPVTLPMAADEVCCGGPAAAPAPARPPRTDQPFVEGTLATPAGTVPRISSRLRGRDRWGTIQARWGVGRMNYTVDPGLYALGEPDAVSPVMVSANYKLSLDVLRASLSGRNAWILVLDTRGINVWCAAGKGTFGTGELVRRIAASGLAKVVSHRCLIVPQLGAPGVAAHLVHKLAGFTVRYGPVDAADLPAYLDAGQKTTEAMRIKPFPLRDRAVLIPVELVAALKPGLLAMAILFALGGIGGHDGYWTTAWREGGFAALAFLAAVIAGVAVHPLLLPWLPGRAFAAQGLWLGAAVALIMLLLHGGSGTPWETRLAIPAWLLLIPAVTAYLAMNFTGCSTFTSLSGVKREMRWALPLEIGMGSAGVLLWFASRLAA